MCRTPVAQRIISLTPGPETGLVPLSDAEKQVIYRPGRVDPARVAILILATALMTTGLTMFLGGTYRLSDVLRPIVVVFGGTAVALLVTFPVSQIMQAWQVALLRGVYGGSSPAQMIAALTRVCDICRRDGLLGVAEIRSNSMELEQVCHLIGDAAYESEIMSALDQQLTDERMHHQTVQDVFVFTAVLALLVGALASLLLIGNSGTESLNALAGQPLTGLSLPMLPFVCGASVTIIMAILLGRLRAAHHRAVLVSVLAFRGAMIILEDNNSQRLQVRLARQLPPGLR